MKHLVALSVCVLAASPAFGWGERGHEIVNEAAARGLPKDAPSYWTQPGIAERLSYLGPEPDRWRISDMEELNRSAAPDHFVDLELAEGVDPAKPLGNRYEYAEHLRGKGQDPAKVGFGPYRVVELCQRIEADVQALALIQGDDARANYQREQARQTILHTAGVLGHYVADLANPHHCTIHYNGWLGDNPKGYPTDKGVHSRFETRFVGRVDAELTAQVAVEDPPRRDLDYAQAIWALVVESNGLTGALYELDKAGAFTEGNEQADAGRQGLAFARQRMVRGATVLRDLWLTATARGQERAQGELLRRRVEGALEAAGFHDLYVRIDRQGVVRVQGKVATQDDARRAREVAEGVSGVGEVRTRLMVLH